jgi:hypothetical protein
VATYITIRLPFHSMALAKIRSLGFSCILEILDHLFVGKKDRSNSHCIPLCSCPPFWNSIDRFGKSNTGQNLDELMETQDVWNVDELMMRT